MEEKKEISAGDLVLDTASIGYIPLNPSVNIVLRKSRQTRGFLGQVHNWWIGISDDGRMVELYEKYIVKIS